VNSGSSTPPCSRHTGHQGHRGEQRERMLEFLRRRWWSRRSKSTGATRGHVPGRGRRCPRSRPARGRHRHAVSGKKSRRQFMSPRPAGRAQNKLKTGEAALTADSARDFALGESYQTEVPTTRAADVIGFPALARTRWSRGGSPRTRRRGAAARGRKLQQSRITASREQLRGRPQGAVHHDNVPSEVRRLAITGLAAGRSSAIPRGAQAPGCRGYTHSLSGSTCAARRGPKRVSTSVRRHGLRPHRQLSRRRRLQLLPDAARRTRSPRWTRCTRDAPDRPVAEPRRAAAPAQARASWTHGANDRPEPAVQDFDSPNQSRGTAGRSSPRCPGTGPALAAVYSLVTVDRMDATLLGRGRRPERRIDAERDADVAGHEFQRAVRRHAPAGASTARAASAWAAATSGVHQIVESAGGSRRWGGAPGPARTQDCPHCTSCGQGSKEVRSDSGPSVYICDGCADWPGSCSATVFVTTEIAS